VFKFSAIDNFIKNQDNFLKKAEPVETDYAPDLLEEDADLDMDISISSGNLEEIEQMISSSVEDENSPYVDLGNNQIEVIKANSQMFPIYYDAYKSFKNKMDKFSENGVDLELLSTFPAKFEELLSKGQPTIMSVRFAREDVVSLLQQLYPQNDEIYKEEEEEEPKAYKSIKEINTVSRPEAYKDMNLIADNFSKSLYIKINNKGEEEDNVIIENLIVNSLKIPEFNQDEEMKAKIKKLNRDFKDKRTIDASLFVEIMDALEIQANIAGNAINTREKFKDIFGIDADYFIDMKAKMEMRDPYLALFASMKSIIDKAEEIVSLTDRALHYYMGGPEGAIMRSDPKKGGLTSGEKRLIVEFSMHGEELLNRFEPLKNLESREDFKIQLEKIIVSLIDFGEKINKDFNFISQQTNASKEQLKRLYNLIKLTESLKEAYGKSSFEESFPIIDQCKLELKFLNDSVFKYQFNPGDKFGIWGMFFEDAERKSKLDSDVNYLKWIYESIGSGEYFEDYELDEKKRYRDLSEYEKEVNRLTNIFKNQGEAGFNEKDKIKFDEIKDSIGYREEGYEDLSDIASSPEDVAVDREEQTKLFITQSHSLIDGFAEWIAIRDEDDPGRQKEKEIRQEEILSKPVKDKDQLMKDIRRLIGGSYAMKAVLSMTEELGVLETYIYGKPNLNYDPVKILENFII